MITQVLSACVAIFKKTIRPLHIWILCCLTGLVLAACSSDTAPIVGEATDFASVCERGNTGKRISVPGYLRLPESFTGNTSLVLRLYATEDFNGSPIGIQIRIGTKANQVEFVPSEYRDTDLKVHLSDGSLVQFRTPVKVSGKVYFPLTGQEFECGLENLLVEPAD